MDHNKELVRVGIELATRCVAQPPHQPYSQVFRRCMIGKMFFFFLLRLGNEELNDFSANLKKPSNNVFFHFKHMKQNSGARHQIKYV